MNIIYLSQLDKLIKHHLVLEYYEQRGTESLCIKELLPLCAALLYPYKDVKFPPENNLQGNILPIIESVRSYTKKTKGLENYSLDGLRKFFQYKWLPTLDFNSQVYMIKGVSLIDKVEDDGSCSIRGNEKVIKAYFNLQVLDISNNYGTEVFEISDENDSVNEVVVSEERVTKNNPIINNVSQETVTLDLLKEFLLTNIPLSKFPDGLKTFDYFWQYKINTAQYGKLGTLLKELRLENNTKLLNKSIPEYGTVAHVVALFISEWYKREYNGYDSNNAFAAIGIDKDRNSALSKKIFEELDKKPYKSRYVDGREEGHNEWLYSIYIEGGLPIKYITTKKERFNKFINGVCKIDNGEDITEEMIEEIVNCFDDGNGVFKRSLESGSCNDYLVSLVKYLTNSNESDLPFNKDDLGEPLFSEFITDLREGYDKEFKFTKEIKIWTYDYIEDGDDSNNIESEFHVQIGRRNGNNVITKNELYILQVHLPDDACTFNIRFKTTFKDNTSKWSEEYRTYFKIGNHCDDFCGAFGSDITTTIDFFNVKEISLWLECGEYSKEIYKYIFPQYLELFSTKDYYLWTTKTNHAARKVLFYDKDIYTPLEIDNSTIQIKRKEKSNWGWISQKDNIILQDPEGKKTTIQIGQSEFIIVDLGTQELKKNVALSRNGCVKCFINDDYYEEVPLLYYSDNNNLALTCDGMKGKDLFSHYQIEFKPLDNNYNRYTVWDNNNTPSQGFIKLRINCRDASKKKRKWVSPVYFIPANGSIVSRNLDNNYIYFNFNGNNVSPLDESLKERFIGNAFEDSPNYRLDSATISFKIGDDNNYVIVDVYRAFRWYQLRSNNSINSLVKTSFPPPIAIILLDGIKIKVVNENGCEEKTPQLNEYIDLFDNPKSISANFLDATCQRYTIDDASEAYQRYVYYLSGYADGSFTKFQKIEKTGRSIFLYIHEEFVDKYKFYYWSGEMDDVPKMLERTKINDNKFKFIFPSVLTNKAVVFQSLQDCTPSIYFRPYYDDEKDWYYYIKRYCDIDVDYLIKCYQIAVEHGVYFCVFPALRILQERDIFTSFIRLFFQRKKYVLSYKDLDDLTRLAKELAMDWFFVNRAKMFYRLKDDEVQKMRECLSRLLLHSPIERGERYYSIRFIDRFLQDTNCFTISGQGLSRKFLKAINDFTNYNGYNNISSIQNRIRLLNELVNTDKLFEAICKIINIK